VNFTGAGMETIVPVVSRIARSISIVQTPKVVKIVPRVILLTLKRFDG